tara:strand:+ start:16124 stop:17422 length:1299 start_codon:yes stop_codon:yes gene_type:complete
MPHKKNHQLVKDAIVYSIANGINRGALLLVFPLILFFYGTEVFGRFSLIWGVSQLLGPIISLSGTTAIIREGTVCRETGAFWTKYFYALTMFSSLVFILLGSIFIYGSQFEWVLVSLLLAFPNALILLKLSQLRILEGTSKYFFLSMQKLIILVFSVLIAGFLDSSFYVVCFCLIVGTGILWLKVNEFPMSDILLTPFKAVEHDKSKILMYCFFVIPHSISTWVMSASDKLVIDYYMDDLNLGIYSISYTLGMILIVINSGLAIALPKYFYKDITTFSAIKMRNKLVFIYTLLALLVSFIVASLISLDRQYIGFLDESVIVFSVFIWISIGIYLLGLTQLYSLYLFYHRKTKHIAVVSFSCALLNVILNFLMIPDYGILGAAIATVISYGIYFLLTYVLALIIEIKLKEKAIIHSLFVILSVSLFCLTLLSL